MDKHGKVRAILTLAALIAGTAAAGIYLLAMELTGSRALSRQPLLRLHDRAAAALGNPELGDVYLTGTRMLRRTVRYDSETVAENLAQVNAYAQQSDVPVALLAAPTAAGIYADELPENAPHADEKALLAKVPDALSADVTWIETASWLSAIREEPLYFRTDSRWTAYGAYAAYKTASRRLGYNAAGFDRIMITHFCDSYYGDLAKQTRFYEYTPDMIDLYTSETAPAVTAVTALRPDGTEALAGYLQPEAAEAAGDPYCVYALMTEPAVRLESERGTRSLLLLCDSYGAAIVPLLAQHYQTLTAVNLEDPDSAQWRSFADAPETPYTQVLILCSADTLARSGGLARLNPPTHE